MEIAWEEAVKEAEADIPRWRLMEIEEDRPNIPDAEISALHIMAARRKGAKASVNAAPNYELIFKVLPPTARLNRQQILFIRAELGKIKNPLEDARKLKDMPRGRFPMNYSDDFISTLVPEHQGPRQIADWLQHDAMLLAEEEKCDRAVESCQAIVNAGRAVDGDPMLVLYLIRITLQHIALTTLERVLAQGQASEQTLEVIQSALQKEVKESGWLAAMRGERAGSHHLFDNLRTGKLRFSAIGGGPNARSRSVDEWYLDTFPTVMLKHYPEHLIYMNRAVEISKLPIHERSPKLDELARQIDREAKETRNILSSLMMPAFVRVHQGEVRSQAFLRSTLVAIACERYRLRHPKNDWPVSVDALVKEKLLDAIPLDPIDGQPVRYLLTKDGIVVYSVGVDLADDKGNIDREHPIDPGVDIGFRLWNVDRRRQPPLPPVALPEG